FGERSQGAEKCLWHSGICPCAKRSRNGAGALAQRTQSARSGPARDGDQDAACRPKEIGRRLRLSASAKPQAATQNRPYSVLPFCFWYSPCTRSLASALSWGVFKSLIVNLSLATSNRKVNISPSPGPSPWFFVWLMRAKRTPSLLTP